MRLLPGYALLALMHDDPIPVLLSILTLKPQRVIVAHSSEGVLPAGYLRDYLAQHNPQLEVQLCDLGDAEDLPQITEQLHTLHTAPYDLKAPYRLDYSAASREQLLAGIWLHLDDHSDDCMSEPGYSSDHLRSYVDQRCGLLICDDSSTQYPVDTAHLSLDSLVQLRGYELTAHTGNVRMKTGHEQAVLRELQALCTRLESANFASRQPGLEKQVSNLTQHLRGIFPEESATQSPSKVNGNALELCTVAALAVAVGQADENVELRMSATVSLRPSALSEQNPARSLSDHVTSPANAEFDALLRIGNRVYTYEAKGSARNARPLLNERDARSRAIFGDATCSAFVTRQRTKDRKDLNLLYKSVEEINDAIPPSYDIKVYILDSLKCLSSLTDDARGYLSEAQSRRQLHATDDVLDGQFSATECVSAQQVGASDAALPVSDSYLVCAVDNPPLVYQACMESAKEAVILLGLEEEPSLRSSVGFPSQHSGSNVRWVRIPQLNHYTAYRAAHRLHPAEVATVTGPVPVAAGLVHYAWDTRTAQLVHITRPDSQPGIHVWRGNPGDGWTKDDPQRAIPWHRFIEADQDSNPNSSPVYQRIAVDDDRLGTVARRYLAHCIRLNPEIEVWHYQAAPKESDVALRVAQKTITNILVTSPFSTCTVSILGESFGSGDTSVQHSSIKAELVQILGFEADAERIVGRLNGHIVLESEAEADTPPQNLLVRESTQFTWDYISDVRDWTAVTSDLHNPALYRWLQ